MGNDQKQRHQYQQGCHENQPGNLQSSEHRNNDKKR